jgi:hypothetical protein
MIVSEYKYDRGQMVNIKTNKSSLFHIHHINKTATAIPINADKNKYNHEMPSNHNRITDGPKRTSTRQIH